jgi:hypothetical protein
LTFEVGLEEGHWAPNGCWEMEGLFICLCREASDWVVEAVIEVTGK